MHQFHNNNYNHAHHDNRRTRLCICSSALPSENLSIVHVQQVESWALMEELRSEHCLYRHGDASGLSRGTGAYSPDSDPTPVQIVP